MKGIKREFSVPRTHQQDIIVERKNRTLIEAARTMLADSLIPISFWAEAVNTACYVQNRVFVTKPQNKTPYELLLGRTPSIGFMRPFGCHVTILNTLDPLGKFDGKVDKGFLVGYSNTDDDAAFGGKKPEFEGEKPEFEVHVSPSSSAQTKKHDDKTKREAKGKIPTVGKISTNNTNTFSDVGPSNAVVSPTHRKSSYVNTSQYPDDLNMPELEVITYSDYEEDVGAEADFTNLETTITVSPIPTTRVRKDHLVTQIIGDLSSATQTRKPKRAHQALKDPSLIEAMQEELLQFKMQKVWVLVDLPNEKSAIGHTQEEGINYEEVFALVARKETIRLFLAYASFMGFMVYQMDVKSAFMYGTIEEEVYVCQPSVFEDPDYPDKVYKVVKALYGLHQALRDLCKAFEKLMKDKFQMSSMGELIFFLGLQVKQKPDGIFISQDKYVAEILRNFGLTDGKSASTPIDTEKPLLKDPDGEDVDVHTYRSMIGSLMYLTSSRLDIMFAVCACARFQVTPKASHLHAMQSRGSLDILRLNVTVVNDVTRLQALVDKKKVIITEATIRDDLRLDDAESIDCLPNEEIFTELSRMGYEKTSTKLTFYKAFLSPQWKFLIHTILQCMSAKRMSWNDFSFSMASAVIRLSTDTPLFEGMIVAQQDDDIADEGAASVAVDNVPVAVDDEPSIPSPLPTTQPPPPSQDLPSTSQDKIAQSLEITKLKQMVKKLERRNKLKVSKLRKLKRVGIAQRVDTSEDTVMDDVSK
nr:retrovirus-related Pol polyprotein from transposon TNT 1-94 [Tanacetum cinerariifolium]